MGGNPSLTLCGEAILVTDELYCNNRISNPFNKNCMTRIQLLPKNLLSGHSFDDSNSGSRRCETMETLRHQHGTGIIIHKPIFDLLIDCKPSTKVVLGYLFKQLKRNSDEVDLPICSFKKKKLGSERIYYAGIKELKDRGVIQKKTGQVYWLNHNCIFRGSQKAYVQFLKANIYEAS